MLTPFDSHLTLRAHLRYPASCLFSSPIFYHQPDFQRTVVSRAGDYSTFSVKVLPYGHGSPFLAAASGRHHASTGVPRLPAYVDRAVSELHRYADDHGCFAGTGLPTHQLGVRCGLVGGGWATTCARARPARRSYRRCGRPSPSATGNL